jgi:hypothetical protein
MAKASEPLTDIQKRFNATAPSSPVNRPAPPKTKRQTTVGAARVPGLKDLSGWRNDLASLSPPKFTSGTGATTSLLFLNLAWSLWRTIVGGADRKTLVRNVAGIWIVGIGILILAEFQPQLALAFAVLFTIGNIVSNVQGNSKAVKTLSTIFTKGG